ncbi:MAG: hypothetical protein QFX36_05695 [Archaeoglobales archaeon]|nr:hypothetical protein [Archaeoglobales archaeon]
MEGKKELKEQLEGQKKRRKSVKSEVEKSMQKTDDQEGVSTLGTFKSDEEIRGYMRRKERERKS